MTITEETMGIDNPEEMARTAMERQGLYSLLATVFHAEMSETLLCRLLDKDFLGKLADVGVDVEALSTLQLDEKLLEDLSVEFTRLFAGPGKHVSPYESVHLGADGGSLWGPETSAVKNFIEGSGFVYDKKFKSLPDHISVELEFMAHLTGLEAEAWKDGATEWAINHQRRQKEFLDRHLGQWIGDFSEKVAEMAENSIYPKMALLARDFITTEHQVLAVIDADPAKLH